MNLSQNFTLDELEFSQRAHREGWNNTANVVQVGYLLRLAKLVLEPLRAAIREPIYIYSGFRSIAVNNAEGGQLHSAHLDGRAADIRAAHTSPRTLCEVAASLGLPVAQIINEFGQWVHIAIPLDGVEPRRDELHTVRTDKGVTYSKGFA